MTVSLLQALLQGRLSVPRQLQLHVSYNALRAADSHDTSYEALLHLLALCAGRLQCVDFSGTGIDATMAENVTNVWRQSCAVQYSAESVAGLTEIDPALDLLYLRCPSTTCDEAEARNMVVQDGANEMRDGSAAPLEPAAAVPPAHLATVEPEVTAMLSDLADLFDESQ